MSPVFRELQDQDIPHICDLPQSEEELFFMFPSAVFPLAPTELSEAISSRKCATVAVQGESVVGFANFYKWEYGSHCTLGNLIVAAPARKAGIGSRLVNHMLKRAADEFNARDVVASCFCANVAGLLFYRRLGFVPFELEARQTRSGLPTALIHMRHPVG